LITLSKFLNLKRNFLYTTIFIVFISACSNNSKNKEGKWSEKDRNEFITSCMDQGRKQNIDEATTKKYCDCMLDRFQQAYTSQAEATKVSLNEMAQLSKGCVD
jgi:hypothetical protein